MQRREKRLPSAKQFIGKTIGRFPNHVIQELVGSGNNGHLFRAFDKKTGSNLAFKIVPLENLPDDESEEQIYLNEAKKPNVISHESVVKYIDVIRYHDNNSSSWPKCVVFVCDYVNGKNLRTHIREHKEEITVPFIETFLKTMFELLYELEGRGFQHGDLHAGNILVAKSEFDVYQESNFRFRVTDFGMRELTGEMAHVSDYLSIAGTLEKLLKCVKYEDCKGRDRYVFGALQKDFLARHLYETNTTVDPLACNPQGLVRKLDSLEDEYLNEKRRDIDPVLTTPFDYPSCEQIGDSHLLLQNLYSDRLLGLRDIQARSNCVLTGPRGCGKTTVFSALSLKYLISTENDVPGNINYIGIYYRCDDLYFSFPRYKLTKDDALNIPMHFIIVSLLIVTLEQISAWAKRHFQNEFDKKEKGLVAELWDLFRWSPPDSPDASYLPALINRLSEERKRAADEQRLLHAGRGPIKDYFGPEVMIEACRLIRRKFSFLVDCPIYFFIDDYSSPKITNDLQANLNRLLMQRDSDIFFKLSTESPVSFARYDVDRKQYVENREYDFINLGLRYIVAKPNKVLEFLEDLFKRRFKKVVGYPVKDLRKLLGVKRRNENATALAFRDGKYNDNYVGCETLAAMCSGDIDFMIRLVARMVDDYGGVERVAASKTDPIIPTRQQHDSVRAAAGAFMESIRMLLNNGQKLADIVTAFGKVAHSYLLYETSANEGNKPPHQASRIEPYEPLRLSKEARDTLDELLRYSIFITDPRGMSRRGQTVPRFYLRRYLIPRFRLTFSRRDSLQLKNQEIEMLLQKPEKFANVKILKSESDVARSREPNPDQERLFENE